MIPTLAQLLAMMATMECHTTSINIPERRETMAYTVCIKVEVTPAPVVEKPKPVAKKVVTKRKVRVGCKKRWYWKNHRKRYRCIR